MRRIATAVLAALALLTVGPGASQEPTTRPKLTIRRRGEMIFKALDARPVDGPALRAALADIGHVEAKFRTRPMTRWVEGARVIDGRIFRTATVGLNRTARGPAPDAWIDKLLAPGRRGLRLMSLKLAVAVAPEVRAHRDTLIAQADAKIRAGLRELARKHPQLKKTNWGTLARALAGRARAGRIALWVGRYHGGKSGTKAPVPKGESYNVLVLLRPLRWPVPRGEWSLRQKYPHLALMGQVFTDAADPQLRADVKKLVGDALVPIEKLDIEAAGR